MNKTILFLLLFLSVFFTSNFINAQETEEEWEMKQYFFVFLNSPEVRPQGDSATVAQLQMDHLAYIDKMFKEGKCRLAGPFLEKGTMRGIWILDAATHEEAEALCKEDPFIKNGYLVAAIKPWYGPAGLYLQPKAKK